MDFFIGQSITNSPLIKDLQNQVSSNRLDSLLILAEQRPQVSFTSNNMYAPVVNGYGYDKAITNGANINALIGVNKSLMNGKANKIQFVNLQLLSTSLKNSIAVSEQDLKKSVISQYITTYGDLLQVNFSREMQEVLIKQETILKKLTEKNVYRQVDYLSFYVSLQQNEFKLKQQLIQYKNDYSLLNYVAGISDTSQPEIEDPGLTINNLPSIDQSVFFKKYEIDSLKLVSDKSIIDITYRPKLNVFADAGYNSSLEYLPYKNFGASVGFNLLIPLYDGKQKRLKYSKIDMQENTRLSNKKFFADQYTQQLFQLNQQLKATNELIVDINEQLKYIQTLITVNQKLLQTGDVRIYDYILSLNNYLNVKNLINENTINRLQIINQINYWNR
ncbi:MAG: hypothetical protein ABI402_06695 [Ferruginibacter sp.]